LFSAASSGQLLFFHFTRAKYVFASFRLKKTNQRYAIAIGIIKDNVGKILVASSMPPETLPAGMFRNATIPRMPRAARSPLKISVEIRARRQARNKPSPVPKPHAQSQGLELQALVSRQIYRAFTRELGGVCEGSIDVAFVSGRWPTQIRLQLINTTSLEFMALLVARDARIADNRQFLCA
jgi:hypothetical protein